MKVAEILQPAVALMIWTMVMWLWMYATRIPAMNAVKLDPDSLARDPTRTLDDILPAQIQWKAHNYNHLHEAPTLFYAVALLLAVAGQGNGTSVIIAWAYVGLRVIHSLVQVTVNKVTVRFALFALSSIALMALIYHAARVVF
ncbi:MAPEG family protein [Novosphingobium sp. MMS21-SN21R]|uniref:MAPEG family protein n=1 Tax=Novosphingobium sp. MMS21-SN21R TaxID=2969298 RepID=UPI00288371EA|nr:MAPEG family protein [Novosphingobium sp. MMS21-SN21R]MDT0508231.1 MAPEG family protein [Novosphingobium sp. MMS21-SN21R]